MKRQAFRLAPVLKLRRTQERVAAMTAARAAGVASAAARDVDEQVAALQASRPPATGSAAGFVAALVTTRMAAEGAAAARDLAVAKAEQAELLRVRWTEAAQRAKGLERLEERHGAALRAADDAAETSMVDDIVTRQHTSRPTATEGPEEQSWTR